MAETPEDNWFPQPDASLSQDESRERSQDEWLVGDDQPPRSTSFDPWSLADRRVLVPVGGILVFLVALLAAFGVFSSSPPPVSVPVATVPTATTPPVTQATTTTAPPPTAAPPTTTLKPGDTGSQVKALQRELASLGYTVGTIDGSYGPATIKAVTAFQRSRHLTPDGIVGPATLLALAP